MIVETESMRGFHSAAEKACSRFEMITKSRPDPASARWAPAAGWSLIDLLITLTVASIMAAFAIPETQTIIRNYRLTAAVQSVTGAIESTRYQAIMRGYPYAVDFDSGSGTYQVLNKPPGATAFVSTGGAIPINGLDGATLSPSISFQFNPQGTVTPGIGGGTSVQISNGTQTKTITVSLVGQVQVTP